MGDPVKLHHFTVHTPEGDKPARVPEGQLDEFMSDMDADGILYEELADDAPIDQPRVPSAYDAEPPAPARGPSAPRAPRAEMFVGEPEVIKSPGTRVEVGDAQIDELATPSVVDVGEEDPADLLAYEDRARSDEAFAATMQHALGGQIPASAGGDLGGGVDQESIDVPGHNIPAAQWGLDPDIGSDAVQDAAIEQELGGSFDAPYTMEGADRRVLDPLTRGFAARALLSGSDEAAGGLAAMAGNDLGDSVHLERALNEQAEAEHPLPFMLGEAAGTVPLLLAAPETIAGRLGLGPLLGVLEGAFSSDSDDPRQTLHDSARGGLWGAGAALTGEALGAGGPALRRMGVAQRRASAAPGTLLDLRNIRNEHGIDYMTHGLDQAFDDLGLAGHPLPQSAAGVNKRIGTREGPGLLSVAGDRMGDAVDTAGAEGVRGDWDRVQGAIAQRADQKLGTVVAPAKPQRAEARALHRIAGELPETRYQVLGQAPNWRVVPQPAPPALPRELQDQKVHYRQAGKLKPGVNNTQRDDIQANAYLGAGRDLADELDLTMQGARPELGEQFTKNRDAYQDLALFEDMSGKQADAVKSRSVIRDPLTYASTVGASGLGAGLSTALGLGPIPGAAAGGLTGATFGQTYGRDALGLGMIGVGNTLSGAAKLAPVAARSSPTQSGFNAPDVTSAAMAAISGDRAALGHYSQRFLEAQSKPDPKAATSDLLVELIQTDPEFRTYILPTLRDSAVQER